MSYTVPDFGPGDLLDSNIEGQRRVKVSLNEGIADQFDQLQTVEYTPLIERKPYPAVNDLRDRKVGTGTVSIVDGWLQHDGTANKVTYYTRDYGRYLPGIFGVAGVGYEIPDPANGIVEFGYGDETGSRIGLNCTNGVYTTFVESGGSRYYQKNRADWLDPLDGTGPSKIIADISRATFRIQIGLDGTIVPQFYLVISDRQNGTRKILIDRAEQPISGPVIEHSDLPIFTEADGGILNIGGRQYGVFGRHRPDYRNTGAIVQKTIGTTLTPVMSFRVKNQTRWLAVSSQILGATGLSDQNGDLIIILGATLTGASWGNVPGIDPENTSFELDISATSLSGGYWAYVDVVPGGLGSGVGAKNADVPDIQIPRGQDVTMAFRRSGTTGTATFRGALRMREEF